LIDEKGEQKGIISLEQALLMAQERNLDLVQVTEKVYPPVCKIVDYGKYLYQERKREKGVKQSKAGEVKGIRLSFAISPHDLETRVNQAEKFLTKGYRVRVELILRGRQKGLSDFAKSKVEMFLEMLKSKVPIKIEMELKKEARGLTMIISKGN